MKQWFSPSPQQLCAVSEGGVIIRRDWTTLSDNVSVIERRDWCAKFSWLCRYFKRRKIGGEP